MKNLTLEEARDYYILVHKSLNRTFDLAKHVEDRTFSVITSALMLMLEQPAPEVFDELSKVEKVCETFCKKKIEEHRAQTFH